MTAQFVSLILLALSFPTELFLGAHDPSSTDGEGGREQRRRLLRAVDPRRRCTLAYYISALVGRYSWVVLSRSLSRGHKPIATVPTRF